MRLFEKITSAFRTKNSNDANADERPQQEVRIQHRYSLKHPSLGTLNAGKASFAIDNISYSGVAISFKELNALSAVGLATPNQQIFCSLTLLGRNAPATAQLVFAKETRAGYFFIHATGDTLLFLRDFLEFMRRGSDMMAIDTTLLKERFREQNWKVFRGTESDDLKLRMSSDEKTIAESLLTFLNAGEYCEVCTLGTAFTTRKTAQKRGSGQGSTAATTQSNEVDASVLRAGLSMLIGQQDRTNDESVALLIQEYWNRLQQCGA
jgi:hypothetical protein